jgi:hypothetical protein
MQTGVQFTDTIAAGATHSWFTWGWPAEWHVVWYLMATSPQSGAPQLDWDIATERADATQCTYWLTVRNLTSSPVTFEARYAVMS